jgi:NADH:ubiquinone oxidoreductase subunit C
MRTVNRTDQVQLPSLTPVWRSAEFQEREIFDFSASCSPGILICGAF